MRIEKTYQVPFPVSSVYDAWVSSDTVIEPATRMDIKPEAGAHYRLFIETPGFTGSNEGEFLLVEPNSHITYTWEWNNDGEVSTIDVVFANSKTGTRIGLSHSGFSKGESVASHDAGWDSYIDGLTKHLSVTSLG